MLKYLIAACFCIILVSTLNAQEDGIGKINLDPPSTLTIYGGPIVIPVETPYFGLATGIELDVPYSKYAGLMLNASANVFGNSSSYRGLEVFFLPGLSIGPRWYMTNRKQAFFIETAPEMFAILSNNHNTGIGLGLNLGFGHTFHVSPETRFLVKVKGHAGIAGNGEGHPGVGGYILSDLNVGWMIGL